MQLSYNNIKQGSTVEKTQVISTVYSFGSKLKNVPLLASRDILRKSMEENYGSYVIDSLIEKWINDPINAPGRLTSSPWPDRIEIKRINKLSKDNYKVDGEIIEITSMEIGSGGYAAKRPVTLLVKKISNRWMIYDVALGSYGNTTNE